MKEKMILVAGAGLWGCTVARMFAEAGHKVTVLEKRAAIGGNVRCEIDEETGIEIHSFGSHIFHTHNVEVWNFVRRFTEFNGYQHKVLARYQGKTYFLPLGLALINKFFGVELAPGEVQTFLDAPGENRKERIFDAFFRGYTSKQWGKAPEAVDPSVIKRLPVRSNYDINYFKDYWQGIPAQGYNKLFDNLVDHPNIEVKLGCEFSLEMLESVGPALVFYSGPIDALFAYKHGALPWRTLRFEVEKLDVTDYQGTSVVNYTEAEVPYTRVHEFKHYHPEDKGAQPSRWGFDHPKTVIMREYSKTWERGDEPYYPIACAESAALLAKYQEEIAALNGRLAANGSKFVCGGRLGEYKYYDMDQSIACAIEIAKRELA